jgi:hypothetical protein
MELMTLAELLEQQAMALPVEERKKLGARLLASALAAPSPHGPEPCYAL